MVQRLKSEHNDVSWRSLIRAYAPLRRALSLVHHAIVVTKLRRLRGELLCHAGIGADPNATPVADAARWPQAPLILGDKWDF